MALAAAILFCPVRIVASRSLADNLMSFLDSARAHGMGGVAAAEDRDATAAWLNPAAPARTRRPSVTACAQQGFLEDLTWQALFAYPAGSGVVIAAGAGYYDTGVVALRTPAGQDRQVSGQQDLLGYCGVSAAITDRIAAGAGVKAMRSELVDEYTARTAAFDASLCVEPVRGITAGVVLLNQGKNIRYLDQAVPLPGALRFGLAASQELVNPETAEGGVLSLFLDGGYVKAEKAYDWRGGFEYRWQETVALRAGASRPAFSRAWEFSSGIGIEVSRYRIDYATRFRSQEGAPHLLSLTVVI